MGGNGWQVSYFLQDVIFNTVEVINLNPYYRNNGTESYVIETVTEVLTHHWC